MRRIPLLLLATALLAGCASLRGPAPDFDGPSLTIRNESDHYLDLAYRCSELGATRRLGGVPTASSQTFTLRPATCTTVYLVSHQGSLQDAHIAPFATFAFLGYEAMEITIQRTGFMATTRGREPFGVVEPMGGARFRP